MVKFLFWLPTGESYLNLVCSVDHDALFSRRCTWCFVVAADGFKLKPD